MKTKRHAVTFLKGITVAVALSLMPAATLWANSTQGAAPPPSMAAVQSAYGHLPLSFEANQGQTDSHVQFLTRGRGHQLFLTPSEAVLTLRTSEAKGAGRERDPLMARRLAVHLHTRSQWSGCHSRAPIRRPRLSVWTSSRASSIT